VRARVRAGAREKARERLEEMWRAYTHTCARASQITMMKCRFRMNCCTVCARASMVVNWLKCVYIFMNIHIYIFIYIVSIYVNIYTRKAVWLIPLYSFFFSL